MELNKVEVAVIENAVQEANDLQLRLLSELQLAVVGGGIADVVVA
jgi:hypothetical protein